MYMQHNYVFSVEMWHNLRVHDEQPYVTYEG